MAASMEMDMKSHAQDDAILKLLDQQESATIELLMGWLGLSWEQVFSTVDRLSRSGAVRLTRVGTMYYIEKVKKG